MNNQNNEGIIIEGGVETTWVRATENSFPVELPVDLVNELTIVGGTNSGNYHIPTMKGLYIFIGATDNAKHQARIKVSKTKSGLENGDYDIFYYDDGEIQHEKGKRSKGLKGKDIKKVEEFYYRNLDDITASSNSRKEKDRINATELYKRIYNTEYEYYKNGGR